LLADGFRYDPETDAWRPLPESQLGPRENYSVVWTGDEMVIWGGFRTEARQPVYLTDGARYDPDLNRWWAIRSDGAPTGRFWQSTVWTGQEMIIWGGHGQYEPGGGAPYLDDGGRYDPSSDAWRPLNSEEAPTARYQHSAAWTGSEMIIWGGRPAPQDEPGDGGLYDPVRDTWIPIATEGAPSSRWNHTGTWTGSGFVVWGGLRIGSGRGGPPPYRLDAVQYHPTSDMWTPLEVPDELVKPRRLHTAVWADGELIVWGGAGEDRTFYNDGVRYRPGGCGAD
jgi:hypothetical protein